ncbi:hypothetical protein ACXR0O_10100 [Verrucomicrobiota bacterium sgz303538]
MSSKPFAEPILRRAAVGFLVFIALCWLVEFLELPHLLFDEPPGFNWLRVLFRTAIILSIWAWVHFTTKRLLKRLHRLEEFLIVCSWCRKIGHQGNWMAMEEFFDSKFHTETSHSICPACTQEQFAGLEEESESFNLRDRSSLKIAPGLDAGRPNAVCGGGQMDQVAHHASAETLHT